jgi:quercetin dioxygenase-like cupin family protein
VNTRRAGILTIVALSLGVTTAVATPPTGVARTDLVRATIADAISASASDASDMAGQQVTVAPGGTVGWHSHSGATFVAVKSGTVTLYTGDASGCTSKTYAAGQAYLEPHGAHLPRNEGSTPVELVATYLAVPVGGELRKNEANPGGANCPSDAAPVGVTRTDLARVKIDKPITVSATSASDISMQTITVDPGGSTGWHSHPGPVFVAVKSGTLTMHDAGATSCTSQPYSAGQGFVEPPGMVQVGRNEGSTPAELYVTYLAVPVGAELRIDQQNPGGANCPGQTSPQAASQLPRTGGAGPAPLLAVLGLSLAGAGLATRVLTRRR